MRRFYLAVAAAAALFSATSLTANRAEAMHSGAAGCSWLSRQLLNEEVGGLQPP